MTHAEQFAAPGTSGAGSVCLTRNMGAETSKTCAGACDTNATQPAPMKIKGEEVRHTRRRKNGGDILSVRAKPIGCHVC